MSANYYERLRRIDEKSDAIVADIEARKARKADREAEQAERAAKAEADEAELERVMNLSGGLDPLDANGDGYFDPIEAARAARRRSY
ncbi:hypothetical protein AB0B97_29830 [Micromonospora sp. NPDC049004]|uniref:hypothetical protein n=1 Tax=Micromonospora sp. NPDC049004 TaxID=3154348 RepID=UPI0033F1A409